MKGATFGAGETMGPRSIAGNRLSLIVHAALLVVGVSTYLISPDDVVWRFIKTAPHPRVLAWIIHDFAGGKRKGALKD